MEAIPALNDRSLMDRHSFRENFNQNKQLHETSLSFEVELLEGDSWVRVDEFTGFLRNEPKITVPGFWDPGRHAELCLLEQIHQWDLKENQQYRVTCYISWSPCSSCAEELAAFLRKNSHVRLRIFASRIYTKDKEYETGLCTLQAAGAQVAIMALKEFEYCWKTFVAHQGTPFSPWDGLDEHSETLSRKLKAILQNREY